ncbi:MAG: nucleotide exchange factor GrpE [Gammaproteobacteria bacterium]|nr:nucleotide exchange factor GrpE [Gammaproteobacteria bacterium]
MTENNAPATDGSDDEQRAGGAAAQAGDETTATRDELDDELEALRDKAEEHWNNYLRAVAELDNLRKRNARDVENARKFAIERFASQILPVRDSLEAALKAASEADPANVDLGALLEGEQATLRLLDQAFDSAGITEIDPEGEPFDPERHEAMSMLPSPTAEPNSVIAVIQKGYALHERVVRPARVVVAQAAERDGSGAAPDAEAGETD